MTLALLCQFTAQHVSDVNTFIFRSLRLLGALLCRLYCADLKRVGVIQPALGYHITNSQSRYITPTRLKSAQYSLHNNAQSSRNILKMDVLKSETCWAVNLHNKTSVIKLIYLYLNILFIHQFVIRNTNLPITLFISKIMPCFTCFLSAYPFVFMITLLLIHPLLFHQFTPTETPDLPHSHPLN